MYFSRTLKLAFVTSTYESTCTTGWGKFYPKGKPKRPEGGKLPKEAGKGEGGTETAGGIAAGGPVLLISTAVAIYLFFNIGRSDAQVCRSQ